MKARPMPTFHSVIFAFISDIFLSLIVTAVGVQRLRPIMRVFPAALLAVKSYGFSNYIPGIQTTVNNQEPCFFIQSVFFCVVNMQIGNLKIIRDLIKKNGLLRNEASSLGTFFPNY